MNKRPTPLSPEEAMRQRLERIEIEYYKEMRKGIEEKAKAFATPYYSHPVEEEPPTPPLNNSLPQETVVSDLTDLLTEAVKFLMIPIEELEVHNLDEAALVVFRNPTTGKAYDSKVVNLQSLLSLEFSKEGRYLYESTLTSIVSAIVPPSNRRTS